MNRENVLLVANVIEFGTTFDMSRYQHSCGSPGCIAGHAQALAANKMKVDGVAGMFRSLSDFAIFHGDRVRLVAANFMDLEAAVANRLFVPQGRYDYQAGGSMAQYITQGHAVACLRNLAETGVVNWEGTVPEPNWRLPHEAPRFGVSCIVEVEGHGEMTAFMEMSGWVRLPGEKRPWQMNPMRAGPPPPNTVLRWRPNPEE